MPRAKNKGELLLFSDQNYNILLDMISSFSDELKHGQFQFEDRDRCVRDVIVHLYEWHLLLIPWIMENRIGEERSFLPEGYNWRTYPKLNIIFWEKHQKTQLNDAIKLFKKTHKQAVDLINGFSEEELFTKKYYDWTGNSSLGSYCVSSLSSHYDWAIKKIKKHKNTFNA